MRVKVPCCGFIQPLVEAAARQQVREVNHQGGFEHWHWAVAHQPGEIRDILTRLASDKQGETP